MRRVVVTGLGAVTPLGTSIRHTWNRLLAGDSGIGSVSHLQPQSRWAELPSRVAGLVPTGPAVEGKWHASDWVDKSEERRMAKFTQYAIAATEMALKDSGWRPQTQTQREMTGVCLGSGIGNLDDVIDTSIAYNEGVSRISCICIAVYTC
jgi:3-oxoacyl-[acyl-carrier-protein] synthase II